MPRIMGVRFSIFEGANECGHNEQSDDNSYHSVRIFDPHLGFIVLRDVILYWVND